MKKRPIWIVVENGDMFEGHQLHWANCFFSNATRAAIEHALQTSPIFEGMSYEIREMTDEELEKYSDLNRFIDQLFVDYGEV